MKMSKDFKKMFLLMFFPYVILVAYVLSQQQLAVSNFLHVISIVMVLCLSVIAYHHGKLDAYKERSRDN